MKSIITVVFRQYISYKYVDRTNNKHISIQTVDKRVIVRVRRSSSALSMGNKTVVVRGSATIPNVVFRFGR